MTVAVVAYRQAGLAQVRFEHGVEDDRRNREVEVELDKRVHVKALFSLDPKPDSDEDKDRQDDLVKDQSYGDKH